MNRMHSSHSLPCVVDSVERSDPTVGVETTLEMKRLDRLRGLFTRTVPSFQLAFVL